MHATSPAPYFKRANIGLQSLIGGRKGVFVDCSKATAEEVVRT